MRVLILVGFLGAAMLLPNSASAVSCGAAAHAPLPVRNSPVPPIYSGLAGRPAALATPRSLLAESRDESLALDLVLMRLRLESCVKDAYAGYKPKTQFDNTPYRFNMDKGKKFTAAEFDAWMKSRGVRVATGRAPVAPVAASTLGTTPVATPAAATVVE